MSESTITATDAIATLGTIIDDRARRDAIHLAVMPVVAGDRLAPGTRVCVNNRVARRSIAGFETGIVDPFLTAAVEPGDRFWLILLPRTIRSLRHVWSHPEIPDEPAHGLDEAQEVDRAQRELHFRRRSELWLREFCDRSDCPDYEYVMSEIRKAARDGVLDAERSMSLGRDASGEIPPEFWDHVEVVLGIHVSSRPTYFSCSC
jgi:hypothetical protein